MERLDRNSCISTIRGFVRLFLRVGTYYVMLDKRENAITFLRTKSKLDYYINIGKIKVEDFEAEGLSDYKRQNIVKKAATEIRKLILAYEKTKCLITYTRAVGEYGKRNVIQKAFVKDVDNPYYKSAARMLLYDKNVIDYYVSLSKATKEKGNTKRDFEI